MARDLSKTGASDGTKSNIIPIVAKLGKFELPDGQQVAQFVGYLDRIDLEFQDPAPEHELPARWAIKIILTAALPGDPPEGQQYTIPLSSHWNNPIMPNLVNGIAGAMEDKRWEQSDERYVRIWLSLKTPVGKRPYCSALGFISGNKGDYLPNKYPWNEGAGKYDGVPSDLEEAGIFWLGVAHGLCKLTGGIVVGEDKATIKLPKPNVSMAIPETPTPGQGELVDKAIAFFDGALAGGIAFLEAVEKTFAVLKKRSALPKEATLVAEHLTKVGRIGGHIPDGFISFIGEWERPDLAATDDLPF